MRTYFATFCRVWLAAGATLAALLCLSTGAMAQQETPKADIAVTYQRLDPAIGNFLGTKIKGANGWAVQPAWNLNRWLAIEGDFAAAYGDNYDYSTYMFGPRLAYRHWSHIMPFAHGQIGFAHLSPQGVKSNNTFAGSLGGGIDANLTRNFGLRLGELDWIASSHNIGPALPNFDVNGWRFRTGLIFLLGTPAAGPGPNAVCSATPQQVFAGEPVTASVSPSNFGKKAKLTYEWSASGGKVGTQAESTQIDTTGLQPGSYTAKAHVAESKKSFADCSTNFTVKQPQPPQVSCSANPTTVKTGDSSTITCTCSSPDGRSVTLSHKATLGQLSGTSGNSVTLNTADVTGNANINSVCTDDRGLTANTSTSVTVEAPPPPPQAPANLALRSVYFATAMPTAARPNAGLVKSQQDTLASIASDFNKYLQQNPKAKLTLTAHADPRGSETYNQKLTERRADAVKNFLVAHNVPADSIETQALGTQHQMTPDEVKQSMEADATLTAGEKKRLQRNMRTIVLAANRRVDLTLTGPGVETQSSATQYPFSAADALSLIGGREKPKAAPATKKPVRKGARKGTRKGAAKKK